MSVFLMFLLRIRSLNSLEQEGRHKKVWRRWVGGDVPSADTLGYVFSRFNCTTLRKALRSINRKLGINKALYLGKVSGMTVVSVDGHEIFSSFSRCCPQCSTRRVKTRDGEKILYYHSIVMCQVVGAPINPILDLEPVRRGEGEFVAAMRLLKRLVKEYPRYFQIVTMDGLYAKASVVKLILRNRKHVVIVLKDKTRDLFEDAQSLFYTMEPERFSSCGRRYQFWDLEHFHTWPQTGVTVRVVRSLEEETVRKRVAGRREEQTETHDWWWVTTLPKEKVRTRTITEIGHWRWEIENKGFNELVNHWGMDHCFKHHPVAIEAFLLTLACAYNLFHAFVSRNINPQKWGHLSLLQITALLYQSLYSAHSSSPPLSWPWEPG